MIDLGVVFVLALVSHLVPTAYKHRAEVPSKAVVSQAPAGPDNQAAIDNMRRILGPEGLLVNGKHI